MTIDYGLREDMKVGFATSRAGGQIFTLVTLIVIVCINNASIDPAEYGFMKWMTLGMCIGQIPWNVASAIIIGPE